MKRAIVTGFTAGVSLACGFICAVVIVQLAEDNRLKGGTR